VQRPLAAGTIRDRYESGDLAGQRLSRPPTPGSQVLCSNAVSGDHGLGNH
jgi:hypothetical protein